MTKPVQYILRRCRMCNREFKMPLDPNMMSRLPQAYDFCCDECYEAYKVMQSGGITQKQKRCQSIHNNMGKALTKGFGMQSEENGVKRLQNKYRLKKFRGLQ